MLLFVFQTVSSKNFLSDLSDGAWGPPRPCEAIVVSICLALFAIQWCDQLSKKTVSTERCPKIIDNHLFRTIFVSDGGDAMVERCRMDAKDAGEA